MGVVQFAKQPEGYEEIASAEYQGDIWHSYGVKFESDGATYSTSILARSFEEAERMVNGLRTTARVDGRNFADVPR